MFTCRRSEILEPTKSPKIFFSTNNTFHLIIMMISVVLCKINEEINYVSIFHNHVVRIWLRNRPTKLSWNRHKNSKLQMLCLEYIVRWYGQFVTNWYHFIEMPLTFVVTHGEIFSHLGHTGPLTVNKIWRCHRGIGEYCVIFMLLLEEIWLHLGYKGSQRVLI